MANLDHPWEPPLAGTETGHIVGALDRLRTTFRWKADDLDAAGLRTRVGASALTLGGLLKHLANAEDQMFAVKLTGEPIGALWDAMGWDGSNDWLVSSAAGDPPEQLYALWDDAVERSRARLAAALAGGGLDQLVHLSGPDGRHASLRRLLCDLIEEYGRHTGHADLLREAVDGRVGEDPPAGWRPRAGRYRIAAGDPGAGRGAAGTPAHPGGATGFTGDDLSGARFERVTLAGSQFERVDLSGAEFRATDLAGARIRGARMTGVVMHGVELADVDIHGELVNVMINGVEVGQLVDAELNRRYPERAAMRPTDPAGFREAWRTVERLWAGTVERARRLDPELLHESVDGEWSFIETLRHLVFATDAWIRRGMLGDPSPWDPLDLPWDEMPDMPGIPRDRTVRPSLEQVLALRQDRMSTVREVIDGLTDESLDGHTEPVEGPGWPPSRSFPVRECLRCILNEEWEHRLYAERDLAALEARGS